MNDDESAPIPLPESEDEPLTSPETIKAFNDRLARGSARMTRIEGRLLSLEGAVDENTKLTQADHDMTAEIREIVVLGRKFFFYLGKVGSGVAISVTWGRKAVLWAGPPIALLAAAWHGAGDAITKWFHGGPP